MPEYKLIYFNSKGRAELIRWLFAYGGIPYTDERIEQEDWPERKKDLPGGKVPVLMVDDNPLPQSLAIARYLAKQVDLMPKDNFEAAYCDAVVDTLSDITSEGYKIKFSSKSEEEKKKEYKEEFFPNLMAPFLQRLNKRLTDREWFVSDKMTWADLMISLVFGEVQKRKAELLEPFPAVLALTEKVRAVSSIKHWVETSPDTPL